MKVERKFGLVDGGSWIVAKLRSLQESYRWQEMGKTEKGHDIAPRTQGR
jgi:hypothetical protein